MKANFDLILFNEDPAVSLMGTKPKPSPEHSGEHRMSSANSIMDTLLDTPHPGANKAGDSEDSVSGLYSALRENAKRTRHEVTKKLGLQMALPFPS